MRHPLLVNGHQPFDAFDQFCAVKVGQNHALCSVVHTSHVQLGPEQPNPAVHTSVGLHSLEQLQRAVVTSGDDRRYKVLQISRFVSTGQEEGNNN